MTNPTEFCDNRLFALQDLSNRCGQIVINQHWENAVKKLEGPDVSIKKGLLALTGIKPDKVFP